MTNSDRSNKEKKVSEKGDGRSDQDWLSADGDLGPDATSSANNFSVQQPEETPAEANDGYDSDVSLEPLYDAPGMFSRLLSSSDPASSSPITTSQPRKDALHEMAKGLPAGVPPPPVIPVDASLLNWTAGLLSSIPILSSIKKSKKSPRKKLSADLKRILSELPTPPSIALSPSEEDWKAALKKPTPSYTNRLTSFLNALEASTGNGDGSSSSLYSVGRNVKHFLQLGVVKRKGQQVKHRPSALEMLIEAKDREEDEEALLQMAMQISLAGDGDGKAMNDKAIEDSIFEKGLRESALDIGVNTRDPPLVDLQTKEDAGLGELRMGLGSTISAAHSSLPPYKHANATKVLDLPNASTLHHLADTALALEQQREFETSMMDVVSPILAPTSNTTASTIFTPIIEVFIRVGEFRFTDLPISVRNLIYMLIVVIRPETYSTTSPRSSNQRRLQPHAPSGDTALFLANRQLSTESRAVFYANNTFTIGNGMYGMSNCTNLHGLEEFVKIVPKDFRYKIRNIHMELVFPLEWLCERRSGDERDFEDERLQSKLLGVGKLLRVKLKGLENVRVTLRSNQKLWGTLYDWYKGYEPQIAVSKNEKLGALQGLVNLPHLHTVQFDSRGPTDVKNEFMALAEEIVDYIFAHGSGPEAERERSRVWEESEGLAEDVVMTEAADQSGITERGEDQEAAGSLSPKLLEDGEITEENTIPDLLDNNWQNPYPEENEEEQTLLADSDETMADAEQVDESTMAIFGLE